MAALGLGGGATWVEPARGERQALTPDAVKLACDLAVKIDVTASDGRKAPDAAEAMWYPAVLKFPTGRGSAGSSGK